MEGAEDIMYLEEEMEQLYKIINKRLYNNDLPVPYFRMHNARYRKKGWNIQYKQNKVCQIDISAGRGSDVMQTSEALGLAPGTLSAERSIQEAVGELIDNITKGASSSTLERRYS